MDLHADYALKEEIQDVFDQMTDSEVVEVWNYYVQGTEIPAIYLMNEIEDVLMHEYGMSLLDIISSIDEKHFYTDDSMFAIDKFGYIVSFSDLLEVSCPYDPDILLDSIILSKDGFGNEEIQAILDRIA